MLYDLWCRVRDRDPDAIALRECSSGRSWTFAELDAATETMASTGPVIFPTGNDSGFVITVLRAWRHGRIVCPVDAGGTAPDFDATALRNHFPRAAHLKTTSATTGRARLVVFNAAQIAADAEAIVAMMGLSPELPNIGVISLAHSYGFSNLVTPLLLHGIPLTLAASPLPQSFLDACLRHPCVTVAAVPAMWRAWNDAGAIPPNVQTAISAGAPLPLALEREVFNRCGLKLHNFYGASECGGIAYDDSNAPRSDATMVGRALPGVQLAVAEDGCLEIAGPAVGLGYWPEPENVLGGGVFRASDLAELHDVCVHLLGRAGDLINAAGRKIAPESIERELAGLDGVRACLVLGLPDTDDARSEIIAAVVEAGDEITTEELRRLLLSRLPAWQVPRVWRRVDSLGVNSRGKLSRVQWRGRLVTEAEGQRSKAKAPGKEPGQGPSDSR